MLDDDYPLSELIKRCLDDRPEKRPDMKSLRRRMEELLTTRGETFPNLIQLKMENEEKKGRVEELVSLVKTQEETIASLQKQVIIIMFRPYLCHL